VANITTRNDALVAVILQAFDGKPAPADTDLTPICIKTVIAAV
jgi:hypothetical protein